MTLPGARPTTPPTPHGTDLSAATTAPREKRSSSPPQTEARSDECEYLARARNAVVGLFGSPLLQRFARHGARDQNNAPPTHHFVRCIIETIRKPSPFH